MGSVTREGPLEPAPRDSRIAAWCRSWLPEWFVRLCLISPVNSPLLRQEPILPQKSGPRD